MLLIYISLYAQLMFWPNITDGLTKKVKLRWQNILGKEARLNKETPLGIIREYLKHTHNG